MIPTISGLPAGSIGGTAFISQFVGYGLLVANRDTGNGHVGGNAVLCNARLGDGRIVDVQITRGSISAVIEVGDARSDEAKTDEAKSDEARTVGSGEGGGPAGSEPDRSEPGRSEPGRSETGEPIVHDLGGQLLLSAMAEPHAHLDKVLTAERVPNPAGDLRGAITAWDRAAAAGAFNHDDMVERATTALELLLVNGVTAVRSHVNIAGGCGVSSVQALQQARAAFDGLLHVQIAALPHAPTTGDGSAANRAAIEAALEAGVELLGGCPHLEPDPAAMIAQTLRYADEAGIDVDLHVDETLDPNVLTLRELARQVRDTGFSGSVTASHCVSLGCQPADVQAAVAREVASAGLAVVTLPQTNLFLQGRQHASCVPRGLTAIAALAEAGVLLAAGADNVQDPFNLLGRSDPLETAALLVLAGHCDVVAAYEMVSAAARATLGMPRSSLAVGDRADLVAIAAPSVRGAIADAPARRQVFRSGRLVASSSSTAKVHRGSVCHPTR